MSHLGCGPAGVPDSDAEFAEVICDLCMAGNAKILSCYYHTLGAFSDNDQELKEEDEYKEARLVFLVGAFSLMEKSPTITVGSFFQFTLNGPLFLFICSTL